MDCLDKAPAKFDECLDMQKDTAATTTTSTTTTSAAPAPPSQPPEFELLGSASSAATVDALILDTEDTEMKIVAVKHELEKDLRAADLKWSLFVAACHTYRFDTCLRPFPPMYIRSEAKDIDALVSMLCARSLTSSVRT